MAVVKSAKALFEPIVGGLYRHWWAATPLLPSAKDDPEYPVLRRVWADQTASGVVKDNGRYRAKWPGSFYKFGSETNLTVTLFEIWGCLPDPQWVELLLHELGVDFVSPIKSAGWSYEFEEKSDYDRRRPIADIVLWFEDAQGEALVVFEAKKPGTRSFTEKDASAEQVYLSMPSIRAFKRRHFAYLVGETDIKRLRAKGADGVILSWERLAGLQLEAISSLPVPENTRKFLLGSVMRTYAGYDLTPEPLPMEWLRTEPSALDISAEGFLDNDQFSRLLWRIPRQSAD